MNKGYWKRGKRAKAGAYDTIDNVTKFALSEDDYEDYEEWVEYTAEELAVYEEDEARKGLAASDYVVLRAVEALLSCDSVADLLATMAEQRKAYRDILSARKQWREKLNELDA